MTSLLGQEFADEDGEFVLSDGSSGNPGCDSCGEADAVCRDQCRNYYCDDCRPRVDDRDDDLKWSTDPRV